MSLSDNAKAAHAALDKILPHIGDLENVQRSLEYERKALEAIRMQRLDAEKGMSQGREDYEKDLAKLRAEVEAARDGRAREWHKTGEQVEEAKKTLDGLKAEIRDAEAQLSHIQTAITQLKSRLG